MVRVSGYYSRADLGHAQEISSRAAAPEVEGMGDQPSGDHHGGSLCRAAMASPCNNTGVELCRSAHSSENSDNASSNGSSFAPAVPECVWLSGGGLLGADYQLSVEWRGGKASSEV